MSKKCARCDKTVYHIEELKCLDKVWHKGCFKCQGCNMTLNMKTYKGYNKLPYCEAHIPKAKATTVAETPELKRITENTKLQSNVKYHAAFEKAKGRFTQVADDPETERIKANTRMISNISYHGEMEKKAIMENQRKLVEQNGGVFVGSDGAPDLVPVTPREPVQPVSQPPKRRIGSIADFDPVNDYYGSFTPGQNNTQVRTHSAGQAPAKAHVQAQEHMTSPVHTHAQRNDINYHMPPQNTVTHPQNQGIGRAFRAMYDYKAQDSDEVSFRDGDLIINCTPIDEGWMTGTVQRNGHTGMLPANYVEPLN